MGRIILPPGLRGPAPGAESFNSQNALGRCLDSAWTGDNLTGKSVGGGLIIAPTAGSALKATARGLAITNTGGSGTMTAIPAITAFPYVQAGLGYFAGSAASYVLSQLDTTSGGYTSRIAIASSTAVALTIRFNFGTTRTLTVTTGSGTNAGLLICAIAVFYSSTDYRFFVNGQQVNGTLTPGTFGTLDRVMPPGGTLNGGLYFSGFGSGRSVSDVDALRITENPELIWGALSAPDSPILWAPSSAGGSAALAGDAQAIASATGALSVAVPVTGAAIGVVTASGALSTAMPLSGIAAAIASASGVVTLGIALSGAALASAVASGQMQIAVALSGTAIAQAAASGALGVSGGSALAGAATAQASATGALSVAVPLAGSAQAIASATGNLTTGTSAALAGAAIAVVAASGALTVTVSLSGAAIAQAVAAGGMRLQVPLSGSAVVQAMASGAMGADAATIYARRNSAKHIAHTGRPASLSTGRRAWHS